MNTIVTSREEILKASRRLAKERGWKAVSIRSVAAACGVSVGSIYYYFPSKTALLTDTVESVWYEIFHEPDDPVVFEDTERCVTWVYARMEAGSREYPGFFTLHSLGFMEDGKRSGKADVRQATGQGEEVGNRSVETEGGPAGGMPDGRSGAEADGKADGVVRMHQTWRHIQDGFCQVLKQDRRVRRDAFSSRFTEEQFAGILFSLMLAALLRKDYNPEPVLEVVRRTLYEGKKRRFYDAGSNGNDI